MLTLAFDTSQDAVVLVFARGGEPVVTRSGGEPAQHLLAVIDAALVEAGATRAQIERIAVGVGPGSFTATRIGVTTARALADALDVPLASIDTLAAVAQPVLAAAPAHTQAWAAVDARRGELFARCYERADGIAGIDIVPRGELAVVAAAEFDPTIVGDEPIARTLEPAALAALAERARYGAFDDVVPVYGRRPDAKTRAERLAAGGAR